MLRKHDGSDEAAALFDDIVRPATGDSDSNQPLAGELNTPQQLAIAEETLRHVRLVSLAEADRLLRDDGLEGVRMQDFWILFGPLITDAASMKGLMKYLDRDEDSPLCQHICDASHQSVNKSVLLGQDTSTYELTAEEWKSKGSGLVCSFFYC